MIKTFIFPRKQTGKDYSLLLLGMRMLFGGLLLSHGVQKLANFDAVSAAFPDPLGVGGAVSAGLAVFGEVVCPVAFILGALYRLGTIPMIVTMAVAFFGVHGGNVGDGELAFAYLAAFTLLWIAGPGRYSVDAVIARRIYARR